MVGARREIGKAAEPGLLIGGHVAACGDDISLIMTHAYGPDARLVRSFAWGIFQATTRIAEDLGLYGAGQDLLSDAFSGNLRGMGPGRAEVEFEERATSCTPSPPRSSVSRSRPTSTQRLSLIAGTARPSRAGCPWTTSNTPPWPPSPNDSPAAGPR
ncbi:hypothetical protein GCM10009733_059580 [Nonomuraea maheshkhaliensis]|uniref:Fructose-1,6-bisphosphate aldolase/phosphatase n=1 Tax=Nonomuraea maheshkhaliensis TaxID=419590 RepID=A0ABN2FNR5_9ACTN